LKLVFLKLLGRLPSARQTEPEWRRRIAVRCSDFEDGLVDVVRCIGEPFARNGQPTQHKAKALAMKLTDWLALVAAVQNGWTFAALVAVLLYLYFSRRDRR
jgi:hypothetical protein